MKSIKASKTVWFNGIALVLAIALPVLAGQGYTGEIADEVQPIVVGAIAGINLVLRYFFTNTSLRG